MLKPDVTNFNRYQKGREAASKEMDHPDFDVNVAINPLNLTPQIMRSNMDTFVNLLSQGGQHNDYVMRALPRVQN